MSSVNFQHSGRSVWEEMSGKACIVKAIADSLLYFCVLKKVMIYLHGVTHACANVMQFNMHNQTERENRNKKRQGDITPGHTTQHNTEPTSLTRHHRPGSRTRPPVSVITVESACQVAGGGNSRSETLTGAEPGLVKVPDTDGIIHAIIHSKVNRRLTFNIIDLAE